MHFLPLLSQDGTILLFVLNKASSVITLLETLVNAIGLNKDFFAILIKITGIAYLIEFAINVCKDAGENGIASKVELARKITNCNDVNSYFFYTDRNINQSN